MFYGIVGHKRNMRLRQNRHRKGAETEKTKRLKKLTGKITWYRGKRKQTRGQTETEPIEKQHRTLYKTRRSRQKIETENKVPAAEIFLEIIKD